MSEYVSVIFCRRCGSRYVEIKEWKHDEAVVYCRTCSYSSELKGFTLGRCRVEKKELDIARNASAGVNEFER